MEIEDLRYNRHMLSHCHMYSDKTSKECTRLTGNKLLSEGNKDITFAYIFNVVTTEDEYISDEEYEYIKQCLSGKPQMNKMWPIPLYFSSVVPKSLDD